MNPQRKTDKTRAAATFDALIPEREAEPQHAKLRWAVEIAFGIVIRATMPSDFEGDDYLQINLAHQDCRVTIGARWPHDRYAGKGYPDRLAAKKIPEEARIIAVADAYDAITSNRAYRTPPTAKS